MGAGSRQIAALPGAALALAIAGYPEQPRPPPSAGVGQAKHEVEQEPAFDVAEGAQASIDAYLDDLMQARGILAMAYGFDPAVVASW